MYGAFPSSKGKEPLGHQVRVVVRRFRVTTMALFCIAFSYETPFMLAVSVFFRAGGVTLRYV